MFDHLPAHKTFTVSNCSHTEDFLDFPINCAIKLNDFFDIDLSFARNFGVAEVFEFLAVLGRELDDALFLITLTK